MRFLQQKFLFLTLLFLIWSGCSAHAATNEKSANQLVRNDSVEVAVRPAKSCTIKGNISKLGKIYHLPGCASYSVTKIDTSKGEHWFCSEAEAKKAGWRKAKNC